VSLTYQQVNTLITTTVEDVEFLSGEKILCVDCDLGHRVDTAEIKYYFTSNLSETIVASGIDFYYKNDEADVYTSIVTNIDSGYYYSTVPDQGAPRYIRLIHTISGTSISGTVNGFEVLNNDSIVDFGADGNLIQKNIITTIADGDQIETIPVYNDGALASTAYISIEPQETNIDNGVSISNSSGGPWTLPLDPDEMFVSPSVLDQGNYIANTQNLNGELTLINTTLSGMYRSRIAYIPYTPFNYLYFNQTTVTGTNAEVSVDIDDPVPTMEVRGSNTKPLDFAQFREMTYRYEASNKVWMRYKDSYIEDESLYFESDDLPSTYLYAVYSGKSKRTYKQYLDISPENKNNFAFIVHYWPLDESTNDVLDPEQSQYLIVGKYIDGNFNYDKLIGTDSGSWSHIAITYLRFISLDKNNGVWCYFYYKKNTDSGSYNEWISDGYHLMYYDSDFSRTIHTEDASTDFIHRLSLDYENDHIWYESISSNSVIKLDNTNTVLASYSSEIDGLNGIAALPDGGCWFANKTKLMRIDSNGNKIDEVQTNIVNIIDIEIDGDDALWIANTEGIHRIFIDGREHFFVPLITVDTIKATDLGLWVQCTDATIKYIKRDLQGIYKTLDKYRGMVGSMDIEVGGTYNGELFPVSHDTYWNSLEWDKVGIEGYMLPEYYYHQVRLTLWPGDGESPKVRNLHVVKNITLENIEPSSSKVVYLKVSVNNVPRGQSYDSNLRVGWSLPLV
jgi:hypothetical protein